MTQILGIESKARNKTMVVRNMLQKFKKTHECRGHMEENKMNSECFGKIQEAKWERKEEEDKLMKIEMGAQEYD